MPDAADADHGPWSCRGRAGAASRLDRVVGGDARRRRAAPTSAGSTPAGSGTSERSSTSDVLGEAAVARQAGELVALAVHVEPATAGDAEPAAVRRVEEHRVADRGRGDAVADGVHPAGVLVAEHERHASRPPASISPSIACRSVAQTPAPPIRTTTSRGRRGSGSGRSTSSSGWWYSDEQRGLHAPLASEVAVRVGVEVVGEPGRERHDRQRRVDGQRARDQRAVADEEALDVVRLAVPVDDRARRVVAHPARALDVRGGEPGPADLRRARGLEHVAC